MSLRQDLRPVFPWVGLLPDRDVKDFAVSLLEAARAAVLTHSVVPLVREIAEWEQAARAANSVLAEWEG